MAPKVLHLSTYDANGGAARAAYALHRAMLAQGIPSRMHVARKGTDDPTVTQGNVARHRIASQLDRRLWDLQRSPVKTWRSPARFSSLTAEAINRSSADVVNLHWVTDGFLSIEEIAKIEKPLVWSMYDMWPLTGTEHYGTDTPDARWRTGYTSDNRPDDESGLDIDRWAYDRKERLWRQRPPIHMVPASRWLANAVEQSPLARSWQVTRVPHLVDTSVFSPLPKRHARDKLLIKHDKPLILFLASAGIGDRRKGFDLLEKALPLVKAAHVEVSVMVVGPRDSGRDCSSGVPIHWAGEVHDNGHLRSLYCAADVVATPSREDNMPLSAMEAQSCGKAVAGFRVGGLPDIVRHRKTGYLAALGDQTGLAEGICLALDDALDGGSWGSQARTRALETWSPQVVVRQYLALYERVL